MLIHDKERPSEKAFRAISHLLDSNTLPNGSQLPPERELALQLGVSRRALREALSRLESDGKIWRGVGRGTIVGNAPKSTRQRLESNINLLTNPTELMEARLALEPSVAALAALHATTKDLEDMRNYLEKSSGTTGHHQWDKWDSALHSAIGYATHNSLIMELLQLLGSARSQTQWGQLRKASLNPESQRLYTQQHHRILEAIGNRDAEQAAQAMRTHLLTVRKTLLAPFNGYLTTTAATESTADD